MLKLKATGTFGLTATYSNGSTGSVQGTWRSDNSSVATVDNTGRVTAADAGETSIVAEFQGLRATQPLRVVPDYQGRFALVVRASRLQGSARIECDLRIFGKTSTTPVASESRAGGRMLRDAVTRAVRRR